jgi:hypothetical protein
MSRKRKYSEMSNENDEEKEPPKNEFNNYFYYFNKFLHLDNNVIGVIFSFISDEFNFLLYLRENKIKPYFNSISWENIDFNFVSGEIEILDDEFINEFSDRLDWHKITHSQICNQNFLERYSDNIIFSIIDNKMKFDNSLDYNFFLKYKNQLDWTKIAQWDYIAEDFIDIFHIELDWVVLSRQQGLTRYLLEKYIDRLILDQLTQNININVELKTEIINRRTQLETIPEDSDLDNLIDEENDLPDLEDLPVLEEEDILLPEHFHPELDQQNDMEEDDEDSDLDINNQYDSDEFFRENIDHIDEMTGINVNEHLFTNEPPYILPEDNDDIDMIVPPVTPVTPVSTVNITDIVIDILDEDRNN